ncbi:hypothetical protein [Streptomyces liliiviolaceus]|nr:hypothetical protein [Streptomyces liliiviolaceus]
MTRTPRISVVDAIVRSDASSHAEAVRRSDDGFAKAVQRDMSDK